MAEVERALVIGKSWFVFDLDFRFKYSDSHFVGDTPANVGLTEGTHWESEKNDGRWVYRRWELGLGWGFSRNIDIYARIPVVWGSVWNNRMIDDDGNETPITGAGLGDVHGGFRFQFLRNQSEDGRFSNSLIANLDMRFPTGDESPGSYIGGPNNVVTIVTGTGTWGFDFNARFKQQLAIVALEVGAGFTYNPTGTVMYLVEDEYTSSTSTSTPVTSSTATSASRFSSSRTSRCAGISSWTTAPRASGARPRRRSPPARTATSSPAATASTWTCRRVSSRTSTSTSGSTPTSATRSPAGTTSCGRSKRSARRADGPPAPTSPTASRGA